MRVCERGATSYALARSARTAQEQAAAAPTHLRVQPLELRLERLHQRATVHLEDAAERLGVHGRVVQLAQWVARRCCFPGVTCADAGKVCSALLAKQNVLQLHELVVQASGAAADTTAQVAAHPGERFSTGCGVVQLLGGMAARGLLGLEAAQGERVSPMAAGVGMHRDRYTR